MNTTQTNPTLTQPIDFQHAPPAPTLGFSRKGVERIVRTFHQQIKDGLHPGAQLVVLRHGQVVVDSALGSTPHQPTRPDTPFLALSIAKSFLALTVLHLVETGQLELDTPIAHYWPEFGQRGKETATIRHALLHQAGIPKQRMYQQIIHWPNWQRITRAVAATPAEHPPGSQTAYHVVNFGFILGEVVRRVTGQPVDQVVSDFLLQPLGLTHTSYGLAPAQQRQASRLVAYKGQQAGAAFVFNLSAIRRALMPAAVLFSTAREIAVLYQMVLNGGQYAGQRYLPAERIADAIRLHSAGYDASMGMEMHWAMGFHLGGHTDPNGAVIASMGDDSSLTTFGHAGQGSSLAWADTQTGLVVVFLCNSLMGSEGARQRRRAISNVVWQALND